MVLQGRVASISRGTALTLVLRRCAGEEYEASNNPGYSETHELAYMQEDKERYTELVKKADDAVFEQYAAKKAAEFAALSADDQVRCAHRPKPRLSHLAYNTRPA